MAERDTYPFVSTAQRSVPRKADGVRVPIRAFRDGSLVNVDWKQALVGEGIVHKVTIGSLTTPIRGGGGAGTIVDIDKPDVGLNVPAGKTIIPLKIDLQMLVTAMTTDADEAEAFFAVQRNDTVVPVTTFVTETPYNALTSLADTSGINFYSGMQSDVVMTTSGIDPSPTFDLARMFINYETITEVGVKSNRFDLTYRADPGDILEGPACLLGYWGGTRQAWAFVTLMWAEFDSGNAKGFGA